MGQHVAGAYGDDAERHIRADQGGRRLPDGAVTARGDDGVVAAALGGLANCEAGALYIDAPSLCDRRAALRQQAHHVLDQRQAGNAGARIFHEEEAAAHAWIELESKPNDIGL